MTRILFNIYSWVKRVFHRPVYRVDVLLDVKYNTSKTKPGICNAISASFYRLTGNLLPVSNISKVFPKHNFLIAKEMFGACIGPFDPGYWWSCYEWDGGRAQYLDWLIEMYIDDEHEIGRFNTQI